MRLLGCAALLIAFGAINACMSFPPLDRGVCGNGVVEEGAGEDCDGFAIEGIPCAGPKDPDACRLTCKEAEKCPDNYKCGSDGICRAPSGRFMVASATFEEDSERILVGDFDGDRARDVMVVGADEQRVHYFDPNGAPASTQKILGVNTRPVIGKLTPPHDVMGSDKIPDPTDDFAFLVGGGIGVMRGSPGRSFAPAQYPAAVIRENIAASVFVIDAIQKIDAVEFPGDEIMGIFQKDASSTEFAFTFPDAVDLAPPNQPIPGPLLGDVAVADLYGGPADGLMEPVCEEAVFAFSAKTGSDSITVVSPCYALMGSLKGTASISLGGVKLLGAPRLADMDDDDRIDIVAGGYVLDASSKKCHVVAIAYNAGNGAFLAPVLIDEYRKDGACDFDEEEPLTLLAAGDLDGDGLGDYIDGRGVHRGKVGEPFAHVASPDARWSSALIEDLNADGILDGIAGSELAPEITFLQGTGNPDTPWNPVVIPTQLPTAGFVSGYFDNDAVRDVAVIERSAFNPMAPSSTTGDALSVLYGRALTSPEAPVQMGRLDTIHGMISGGSVRTSALPDGMSDILVTAGRTPPNKVGATKFGPGRQNVLFFSGSADRTLQSPFRLSTQGPHPKNAAKQEDRPNVPLQIALGQFDEDDRIDIAALSMQERGVDATLLVDYFAWLIPGAPDAELAPVMRDGLLSDLSPLSTPSDPLVNKAPDVKDLNLFDTTIGAINLDGVAPDEIVGFSPTKMGVRISTLSVENHPVTYKDKMGNDAQRTLKRFELRAALPPDRFKDASQVTFADVDGDGKTDILGIFTLTEAPAGAPPVQRLMVFINNTPGLDGMSDALFKEIPDPPVPAGAVQGEAGMPVRAFALLNADTDPATEIAVITEANTFIYDLVDGAYKFEPNNDMKIPEEKRNYVVAPGGDVAAAGDVNNDGIDDLIIGSSISNVVSVYRGGATNPR